MRQAKFLEVFNNLPTKRKQVLLGILRGDTREKIMTDVGISKEALTQHKRQLYKNFEIEIIRNEVDDSRSGERKLPHLIALFGKYKPDLVSPNSSVETSAERTEIRKKFNNLPSQLTSFIGGEQAIADVKDLLTAHRLLTITGSPGCGKTRLALQVANKLLENYVDGICWVELATLKSPSVIQEISRTLKLSEQPKRTLTEILKDFLESKSLLLVLDNCEHLLDNCSQIVETLLKNCPQIQILTTSRERLRIDGERVFRVPIISLNEAMCLFIERATAISPDFQASNRNTIEKICEKLDRLPLAIELVAARVNTLTVEQICQRLELDPRFLLLTKGSRTLSRQQTLEAAIDWSYNLLSTPQSILFRCLSIFCGSWSLEAIEEICVGEEVESSQVIDLFTDLVQASLIERFGNRYRFLQSIQDYSRNKLESLDKAITTKMYKKMSIYFSHLLSSYQKPYSYFEPKVQKNFLLDEGNIKVVLDFYKQNKQDKNFVELAISFCNFLTNFSRWQEVVDYGEEAVYLAEKIEDNLALAHLYTYVLAWPMWMQGDYKKAREYCMKGLKSAKKLDEDNKNIYSCFATHNQHKAALQECQNTKDNEIFLRNLREMQKYASLCLEFANKLKENTFYETLIGMAYGNLGYINLKFGDYEKAEYYFGERLKLLSNESEIHEAARLLDVAIARLGRHDYAEAKATFEKAQSIAKKHDRKDIVAEILFGQSRIQKETGDLKLAKNIEKDAYFIWKKMKLNREPFVCILDKPISKTLKE